MVVSKGRRVTQKLELDRPESKIFETCSWNRVCRNSDIKKKNKKNKNLGWSLTRLHAESGFLSLVGITVLTSALTADSINFPSHPSSGGVNGTQTSHSIPMALSKSLLGGHSFSQKDTWHMQAVNPGSSASNTKLSCFKLSKFQSQVGIVCLVT